MYEWWSDHKHSHTRAHARTYWGILKMWAEGCIAAAGGNLPLWLLTSSHWPEISVWSIKSDWLVTTSNLFRWGEDDQYRVWFKGGGVPETRVDREAGLSPVTLLQVHLDLNRWWDCQWWTCWGQCDTQASRAPMFIFSGGDVALIIDWSVWSTV